MMQESSPATRNNNEFVARTNGPDNDLTELAAPAPVHEDTDEWTKTEHLETEEKQSKERQRPSAPLTQLYLYGHLIFFSILGTLARLGVQWLTFYPGAPVVFSNLWANVGGTIVMGFLSEDRQLFREEWGTTSTDRQKAEKNKSEEELKAAHGKVKKTIPLFVGLATGFCGSFTSFSTFMRDVFFALANTTPTPINHPGNSGVSPTSTVQRNGGYSFMAVIDVVTVTAAMCMGALFFGAHVAVALEKVTPTLPFRLVRRYIDPTILLLGPGCWLGAVLLSIFPPDRPGGPVGRASWAMEEWRGEVLFALVFAPIGCLARYYVSLKLNSRVPAFPFGTFLVNMVGTAVLSMCYSLQHIPLQSAGGLVGGGLVGCQVLQGVEDGFNGCLTTVSTLALELGTLRRKHAYFYGISSVLIGLALTVVIMGSVKWTIGFQAAACVTGKY